jgi:hypothetical protein
LVRSQILYPTELRAQGKTLLFAAISFFKRCKNKKGTFNVCLIYLNRIIYSNGLIIGAPGAIRTPDPLVRSQILYPTELRAQGNLQLFIIAILMAESEGFEPSIQI